LIVKETPAEGLKVVIRGGGKSRVLPVDSLATRSRIITWCRQDATQLIHYIYGFMTDQHEAVDIVKDREYWKSYIEAVDKQEPPPPPYDLDQSPTSHSSLQLPPYNNPNLAPSMVEFLRRIDELLNSDGRAKRTPEAEVDVLPEYTPRRVVGAVSRQPSSARSLDFDPPNSMRRQAFLSRGGDILSDLGSRGFYAR
jgi:hypothetical protein